MQKYTTPSTPVDINQQFQVQNSSYQSQCTGAWSLALKLDESDDGLHENTDYKYAEDETTHSALSSASWTDGASITIGDGSASWLVFTYIRPEVNDASSSIRYRLGGDLSGYTSTAYAEYEGEDPVEVWQQGAMYVLSAVAADTAVTLQMQTDSGTAGGFAVGLNRIAAVRLNAFTQFAADINTTGTEVTPEDTWVEMVANKGFVVSASAADVAALGAFAYTTGDTNKTLQMRMEDDGAEGEWGGMNTYGMQISNGSSDRRILYYSGINTVSGTYTLSTDLDVQEKADVSPASERLYSNLVLLELNLQEKPSRSVTAATQALAISEYQAYIGRQRGISASTQALAISEAQAAISTARGATASVQSLAITQLAATVGTHRGISATTQALGITEQQATVAKNVIREVQAAVQNLTITALSASINKKRQVAATLQALSLTTYSATIGKSPAWTPVVDASTNWSAVADASSNWTAVASASTNWSAWVQ
ncbi:MAG: hypothetical protein GY918_07450, partial [Gammaproteobacteria bacterium]|nr:hypothetical protein [Gammaproteobacteria bacterium]